MRVRICREVDSVERGRVGCMKRWAARLKGKSGFSENNIRTFYYSCWRKSGGHVCRLIRYDTLRKTEAAPLANYNLTQEKVRRYFRDKRLLKKEWATDRGFSSNILARALSGKLRTVMCARALAVLAADVHGHERDLVDRLGQLRKQRDKLGRQITDLERRLSYPARLR